MKKFSGLMEPIEVLSKKLRVGVDFQDDIFCTEKLMNKIKLFIEKIESNEQDDIQ